MIQFTITNTSEMSAEAQARMAIDAGCTWVEFDTGGLSADAAEAESKAVIDLCRDAGVILTFTHDDLMLDRLRVHGIHLSDGDADAATLRENLGGHPIIGVDATEVTDFKALRRADVDYVVDTTATPLSVKAIKEAMEAANVQIPIVVKGTISEDAIPGLIAAGASGLNITLDSLSQPNPGLSLSHLLAVCESAKG